MPSCEKKALAFSGKEPVMKFSMLACAVLVVSALASSRVASADHRFHSGFGLNYHARPSLMVARTYRGNVVAIPRREFYRGIQSVPIGRSSAVLQYRTPRHHSFYRSPVPVHQRHAHRSYSHGHRGHSHGSFYLQSPRVGFSIRF